MNVEIKDLDFAKGDGLIPVVVQDAATREVLTVAYMNVEALRRTVATGYAHYWSRSQQRLRMKGETSGHTQHVRTVLVDCDRDALVILVQQEGAACHTGARTCFHNTLPQPR
jgi:phosphoribosyl-AMP cyclohydrolase